MTFVPEWLPVLHALDKQFETSLPFENGRLLNLWRESPCDLSNSVAEDGDAAADLDMMNVSALIEGMVKESKLDPIREIRRDPALCSSLKAKLEGLVKETTLDRMQLVSFIDSLRNPVHLTQGPPGTGKSYLGVVIVRALIIIRDLWLKKSQTIGSAPILVLSYKNHAIYEFLVDLVNTEQSHVLGKRLVRIGGQCKDQRLLPYSERSMFFADADVKRCKKRLNELDRLRESIRSLMETCVSSFLAFKLEVFGTDDDTNRKIRAAYEATETLVASLVRRKMLLDALEEPDGDNEQESVSISTRSDERLSFLILDEDRKTSAELQKRIDRTDSAVLAKSISDGVAHYRLPHIADALYLWITGKTPLPLCEFRSTESRVDCENISDQRLPALCSEHRCHFMDPSDGKPCDLPCLDDGYEFCSDHVCGLPGCVNPKLADPQLYCMSHACKRCTELGLIASPAEDDPPRYVCLSHPMCCARNCMQFCSDSDIYCDTHGVLVCCTAMTKKGNRCKGRPISRSNPFCFDHVHLNIDLNYDEEEKDRSEIKRIDTNTQCTATTTKKRQCKGVALPGSTSAVITRLCFWIPPTRTKERTDLDISPKSEVASTTETPMAKTSTSIETPEKKSKAQSGDRVVVPSDTTGDELEELPLNSRPVYMRISQSLVARWLVVFHG